MWKQIPLFLAFGLLAACGGGGSGGNSNPTLPGAFNSPPQITGAPSAVAQVGQLYQFTPAATDADGDTLTFRIENRPDWATFSPTTGRLEGTPTSTATSVYERVLISVSDGKSASELPVFSITVQGTTPPENTPPTISGTPATSSVAGNAYEFIPQVVDPDGQTLAFTITGKPAWAEFDTVTGRLWGTPAASDVGTSSGIVISVSDGVASASLPGFSIQVTGGTTPGPTNRPPTITGSPAGAVAVGQAYSFTPSAADPDGQALTFSITNKPSWATFSTSTGRLSGTPAAANVGSTSNIVISVTDGAANASLPAFAISVVAANGAPTISGTPATTVTVGQAYSFTPTASDPNGQALTFSITNKPSWATFSASTGRLSGTPAAANVGSTSNIVISVTDGAANASLPAFAISVVAANGAPTISGTPATTVTVGQAYSFTPTASDPNGQALTFSITNKPSWATFSASTGRLSGTPAAANVGSTSNIVISVTDGAANASLPAFAISVVAANGAPTISGTPATTVTVGQAYSFTPTASDPNGQALTFSITNKPSWATFSASTGRLSGTPAAANVGSTSNIVISVTDGAATTSLPAFTITVNSAVTPGTAELTWTRPTKNEDGSTLSNLAGYKVRYGLSASSLTQVVDVVGATVTSASIEGLSTGTWYFSIASYTSAGVESAPTGTVYVTLP